MFISVLVFPKATSFYLALSGRLRQNTFEELRDVNMQSAAILTFHFMATVHLFSKLPLQIAMPVRLMYVCIYASMVVCLK